MNIMKLMKQAQQMQAGLAEAKEKLASQTVDAEGASGKIKVTATCDGVIKSLSIDPSVVDPDDTVFLQELILATINNAINLGKEKSAEEMKKLTGGLNLPAGLGGF